jgi:LPS export ABC transporter protein LptC
MGQWIVLVTMLLCLGLGAAGCGGGQELPVSEDALRSPYQEFDQATLLSFEGSIKKWRLQSAYMRKPLSDTGAVLAVPVVLSLFDSGGTVTTKVLSDSGTTTAKMESFTIWGDAYVRTRDGLVVRTERLRLDANTRMWYSDTFVEIRTAKGDVMRGKGFEAREDFSHSIFRKNVSGEFPQFRDRVESDDSFF